jgi:hypothetical protein
MPKLSVRRVLSASEIPPVIALTHEQHNHAGIRNLYFALAQNFHSIPRVACEAYIHRCAPCAARAAKKASQHHDFEKAAVAAAAAVQSSLLAGQASNAAAFGAPPGIAAAALGQPLPALAGVKRAAHEHSNNNSSGGGGGGPQSKRARMQPVQGQAQSSSASSFSSSSFAALPLGAAGLPLQLPFLPRLPAAAATSSVSLPATLWSSQSPLAPLTAYWAAEMRAPLLTLVRQAHPGTQPHSVTGDAMIPSSFRRALGLTPLASQQLSRALGGVMVLLLLGLERHMEQAAQQQQLSSVRDLAGCVEAWLALSIARLTRSSVLGHRLEMAGRRAVREHRSSGSGEAGAGTEAVVPPSLVLFMVQRLVSSGEMLKSCPHVLAMLSNPSSNSNSSSSVHSTSVADTLACFLAGVVQRWGFELLESAGVMAHACVRPAIQTTHLHECIWQQQELLEMLLEHCMWDFTHNPAADAEQLLPSLEGSSEANSAAGAPTVAAAAASSSSAAPALSPMMWWTPGVLNEARKEAALECILASMDSTAAAAQQQRGGGPSGYPDSFTKFGIVVQRAVYASVEATEPANAASATSATAAAAASSNGQSSSKRAKGKRAGAGAAAAASASVPTTSIEADARAHDAAFAAFASSFVDGQSTTDEPVVLRAADNHDDGVAPRRLLADVEVTDGAGEILFLRVELFGADADADSSLGRISNRANGRVLAELLPSSSPSSQGSIHNNLCLLLENVVSAPPVGRLSLALSEAAPVYTHRAASHGEGHDAAAAGSTEPLAPVFLRSSAGSVQADPIAMLPPLARVLQEVVRAVHDRAHAASSSHPPLALRIELRQRLLLRYGFADVDHQIAREPALLHLIAAFDPAHLPHGEDLSPPLRIAQQQQSSGTKKEE